MIEQYNISDKAWSNIDEPKADFLISKAEAKLDSLTADTETLEKRSYWLSSIHLALFTASLVASYKLNYPMVKFFPVITFFSLITHAWLCLRPKTNYKCSGFEPSWVLDGEQPWIEEDLLNQKILYTQLLEYGIRSNAQTNNKKGRAIRTSLILLLAPFAILAASPYLS